MAALAELAIVAHGGDAGAIVESLVVLAVVASLVAVWMRERRTRGERTGDNPARLRDEAEDDESSLS